MPFGLQPIHLIIVAVVALLIFGPTKLPEIGRSVGRAITEFRRGAKEMSETFMEEVSQPGDTANQPSSPQVSEQSAVGVPITSPAIVSEPYAPNGSQPASSSASVQTAGDQVAEANFCIHCGNANPAGAVYCNRCGSKIAE